MECHLVIKASPLFLVSSTDEEKPPCLHDDNTAQTNPDIHAFCSSDVLDDSTVFPHEVQFPAESSFLTPGWVEAGPGFNRLLKSNRHNYTKQESTRILDMIKYSPKFLRKRNAKQPCKNVSPSTLEDETNGVLHGDLSQKPETNPGSVSPKTGFRKKVPSSVSPKDTAVLEYITAGPAVAATDCMSGISHQDNSELGSSKGRKNWRKVKAALKRMNDSGEEFKPVLANSEEKTQGDITLRVKLPSVEMSLKDDDDNEEDIYQRLKAFLNHSEKKLKTQWSPRLRNKFGFWPPKGAEAGVVPCPATPAIEEQSPSSSPLSSNQFPVLRSKLYPVGRRRCSAPEPVLRREAEIFSFMKNTKDKEGTLNTQNKPMKCKKDHAHVRNRYREQEVRERMRFVMEKSLKNLTSYCPEMCGRLNAAISEEITQYIQSTGVSSEDEQKKIVCLVYIGAVKDDGIHAAVRCMWIPGEDHLVVCDYQNHSLYALAVVFTASC